MLVGEYNHTIDNKGRIFVPAKLRASLGETFILCKGIDECLWVYPLDSWAIFNSKLDSLSEIESRRVKRFFYASVSEMSPDSQGRIVLGETYRKFAGLNGEATIIGNSSRLEIWNPEKWRAEQDAVNNDELVSTLIKLGF